MTMTARQRRFAAAYIVDLNATRAAVRAGYSARSAGRTGWRLLRHEAVAAEIDRLMSARARDLALTANDVVAGLLAEARRTGEGSSHGARVAAWTTLAKHLGMLIERREVGAPGEFRDLDDDSLKDRARRLARQLGLARADGAADRDAAPQGAPRPDRLH